MLAALLFGRFKNQENFACEGLSLEGATDITTLTAQLDKIERQLRELSISSRTRYASKQHRDELRSALDSCSAEKAKLGAEVDRLRCQEAVVRIAVEAAQSYLRMQLPHQTVGDAVLLALRSAFHNNNNALYGMSVRLYDAVV